MLGQKPGAASGAPTQTTVGCGPLSNLVGEGVGGEADPAAGKDRRDVGCSGFPGCATLQGKVIHQEVELWTLNIPPQQLKPLNFLRRS